MDTSKSEIVSTGQQQKESPGESSKQPNEDRDKQPPKPVILNGNSPTENVPKCGWCLSWERKCYGAPPCNSCAQFGWSAEKCQAERQEKSLEDEERRPSSEGENVGDRERLNYFDRFTRS